jgi:hypothetical protein
MVGQLGKKPASRIENTSLLAGAVSIMALARLRRRLDKCAPWPEGAGKFRGVAMRTRPRESFAENPGLPRSLQFADVPWNTQYICKSSAHIANYVFKVRFYDKCVRHLAPGLG